MENQHSWSDSTRGNLFLSRVHHVYLRENKMNLFFIEITGVYGGEANYSWVTRHIIKAKTTLGAVNKVSRRSGLKWRNDGIKYVSKSGATCAFVEQYDEECHNNFFRLETDER